MSDANVAPGQSLGYLYQYDRATYILLNSNASVIEVGVEDVDDIHSKYSSGEQIREQNKSTTSVKHPLTDKSVALWKTIAIWANDLKDNPDQINNTQYHLVTNGEVPEACLSSRINKAVTEDQSKAVSTEILTIAPTLRDDLAIFGKTIGEIPIEMLSKLIQHIFVFDRVSPQYGGNLEELQTLYYYPLEIKAHIFDLASGWVRRQIREAVERKEPPKVFKKDFDKEVKAWLRSFQLEPLLAFIPSLTSETTDEEIQNHRYYGFVHQLDWIECEESDIRDAIIHYIYAKNTRIKWSDAQLVPDSSLKDYEQDLIEKWKLICRRVGRREHSSRIQEGQERLDESLNLDSHIQNQIMPKQFTCGSLHSLANFNNTIPPQIGWHPDYRKLANNSEEENEKHTA